MICLSKKEFQCLFPVSRETLTRLEILVAELIRWNSHINLVSKRSLDDVWRRHILDSAQLYSLTPKGATTWVDLGSGAGFPALVIAALAHQHIPELHLSLIESDTRKCTFLTATARLMGINVTVENRRIQQPPSRQYDVVSARALAPLSNLLDLVMPYMAPNSIGLFPKGATVDRELTAAKKTRHMEVIRLKSVTDPSGVILQLKGVGDVRSGCDNE